MVGPFGEVLATCSHKPETVSTEIDFAQVAVRRENMPFEAQRRSDLYTLTGQVDITQSQEDRATRASPGTRPAV